MPSFNMYEPPPPMVPEQIEALCEAAARGELHVRHDLRMSAYSCTLHGESRLRLYAHSELGAGADGCGDTGQALGRLGGGGVQQDGVHPAAPGGGGWGAGLLPAVAGGRRGGECTDWLGHNSAARRLPE